MSKFNVKILRKVNAKDPVVVEGLPGIGHVGRIAAKHLTNELHGEKFAIMHSDYFPPQVLIRKSGLITTMKTEFYFWNAQKSGQNDIIFVIGNTQGSTPEGQYALSRKIFEIIEEYNIRRVYTLGGLGVGRMVEKPKVFGAVTSNRLIPELENHGVVVKREGVGQIIGVSGLLLGIAKMRGIEGVCLMGETSGFYFDPNSAKAVLNVLTKMLNVEIDMDTLSKRVKEAEKRVAEAQRMERKMMEEMGMIQREPSEDEMRYIG